MMESRSPVAPIDFFSKYHTSTKAGPNGHAFGSLFKDLEAIPPSVMNSIMTLGGGLLKSYLALLTSSGLIQNFGELSSKFVKLISDKPLLGRLTCVSDKNGKLRVIAIFDYWSQTSLKGLHTYLYKVLECFPQDCTYDQGGKVKSHLTSLGPYYCVDLKNATDRFPVAFQVQVLSRIIGSERAEAWRSLMVDRDFATPPKWGVPGNILRYSVGQPLGAYSSWAAFTISHHVLIRHCFDEVGVNPKGLYLVLGDDVVIANRPAARRYMYHLRQLGVETSPMKTLVSRDTLEFAKRYWYKGIEVSPIPVSGFIKTCRRIHLLVPFLYSLTLRGYGTSAKIPLVVGKIYRLLAVGRVKRLAVKARIFLTMSNIVHGRIGENEGLNTLAPYLSLPPIPCQSRLLIVANTMFTMAINRLRNVSSTNINYIVDIGRLAMDPPSLENEEACDQICMDNMVIPISNTIENSRATLVEWLEYFRDVRETGRVDLNRLPIDHLIFPSVDKILREESPDEIRNMLVMSLANQVLRTWKQMYHRADLVLLAPSPDLTLMI